MIQFDFGITDEIDYIDVISQDTTEDECEVYLQKLLNKSLIPIGEKTEGEVYIEKVDDKTLKIEVRTNVCHEVGEDWYDDEWEESEYTYLYDVQTETFNKIWNT